MKSFKNFLNEKVDKDKVNRSLGDVKYQNELIKNYKKSSIVQPELFDTSKGYKENIVKDVNKPEDIIGGRKRSKLRGRPLGSTNKNKITNTNTQPEIDFNKTNNKINKINKNTIIAVKPGEVTKELKKVDEVIPNLPGTNTTVKGSNTYINPSQNRVTTNLSSRVSSTGRTIKDLNKELGTNQLLDRINKPEVTTSGNVKNTVNTSDAKRILDNKSRVNVNKIDPNVNKVTTNIKKPNNFSSFLDRMFKATGVKTQSKYKSKFLTPSSNVSLGVDSKKVLSNVGKNALRSKILRGLGRFAGGVYAGKDFYDKQKEERIKGRSKTSQIVGGLSKALGGYVGGAIGATAGTLAGGGIGSFALGTGGAITGYNIGSRIGDQLYKTGRQYATGERKLNLGKTFKNLRNDVNANVNKLKNKFK